MAGKCSSFQFITSVLHCRLFRKSRLTTTPLQTLYEFPDLSYKDSQGFKGIKPPGADLIEDVYKNVRFDIRFYEEVQVVEGSTSSPPKFLISADGTRAFAEAAARDRVGFRRRWSRRRARNRGPSRG